LILRDLKYTESEQQMQAKNDGHGANAFDSESSVKI
jgi:hypothetical protein